jgi:hypothetical protein
VITVKPNEVAFLYAHEPIDTQVEPIILRLTVRASDPAASVALVALRGSMKSWEYVDGSAVVLQPVSSAALADQAYRLVLLYQPDQGNLVTPAPQVTDTDLLRPVTVWIDKVEIFRASYPALNSTVESNL